jgi:tetratricopeptide (TPR) repeat protein
MVRMPWTTYLWPGLPHLWYGGLWSGLALAAGFAVLVNVLLLATFVWVELLDPRQLQWAWLATGGLWAGSAVVSAWYGRGLAPRRRNSAEAMFREALREYLQGSWFEAEQILGRLLRLQPRDVEARLMLATLMRHTKRHQEALEQLDRLELLADASKWDREIAEEKKLIAAESRQPDSNPAIDTSFPAASSEAA